MAEHKYYFLKILLGAGCLLVIINFVVLDIQDVKKPAKVTYQPQRCVTSVLENYKNATVVMTGQVGMVLPSERGAKVIIDPINIFKGTIAFPTVTLLALDQKQVQFIPGASTEMLNFQSGQPPYLLYLRRQPDETYITDACAGTRLLGQGLTNEENQTILQTPVL